MTMEPRAQVRPDLEEWLRTRPKPRQALKGMGLTWAKELTVPFEHRWAQAARYGRAVDGLNVKLLTVNPGEGKVTLFLSPEPGEWTPEQMGFAIDPEASDLKLAKRVRRLVAPHEDGGWYRIDTAQPAEYPTEWGPAPATKYKLACGLTVMEVTLPEHAQSRVEGMHIISPRTFENIREGCRITVLTPNGLAKGHAVVLGNQPADVILFGLKPDIRSARPTHLFLGQLQELHPMTAWMDSQTANTFGLDEALLADLASAWAGRLIDAATRIGEVLPDQADWVLAQAAKRLPEGVWTSYAPLVERAVRTLMGEKDGISVGPEVALVGYLVPDLTVFVNGGLFPSRSTLKPGECRIGAPMEAPIVGTEIVAATRSPNHWPGEAAILEAKGGSSAVFFEVAWETISQVMKDCGGADNDDRFVVWRGVVMEAIAAANESAKDFPTGIAPATAEQAAGPKSRFDAAFELVIRRRESQMTLNRRMVRAIRASIESPLSIGPAVNAVMAFVAAWWYGRVDNGDFPGIAALARDAEALIDSVVKDGRTNQALAWASALKAYRAHGPVPDWMADRFGYPEPSRVFSTAWGLIAKWRSEMAAKVAALIARNAAGAPRIRSAWSGNDQVLEAWKGLLQEFNELRPGGKLGKEEFLQAAAASWEVFSRLPEPQKAEWIRHALNRAGSGVSYYRSLIWQPGFGILAIEELERLLNGPADQNAAPQVDTGIEIPVVNGWLAAISRGEATEAEFRGWAAYRGEVVLSETTYRGRTAYRVERENGTPLGWVAESVIPTVVENRLDDRIGKVVRDQGYALIVRFD